jgi:hypothetical protein
MLKCKTGDKTLNDILYGGFPVPSNIQIIGYKESGVDVFANIFMAEGLKDRKQVILTTDKPIKEIEEEMSSILPSYKEIANTNLYILNTQEENLLERITDTRNTILDTIERRSNNMRLREQYRVVVSAQDMQEEILEQIAQWVKEDGAVAIYLLDDNIREFADGGLIFEKVGLRNYLSIRGQLERKLNRVRYTFSKSGFDFSKRYIPTISREPLTEDTDNNPNHKIAETLLKRDVISYEEYDKIGNINFPKDEEVDNC